MRSDNRPPQLDDLLKLDGYLWNYQNEICRRYGVFLDYSKKIEEVKILWFINQ